MISPEREGGLPQSDSKLVPWWFIGERHAGCAFHFLSDLLERLSNRVQLTTDGHKAYLNATERVFGTEIDYAVLHKISAGRLETKAPAAKCSITIYCFIRVLSRLTRDR